MVRQLKRPKLSRQARLLRARIREQGFQSLTVSDRKAHFELLQFEVHVENERFLLELANLHDSGYARFRNQWGYDSHSEAEIMGLRDYLRAIWENELSTDEVNRKLADWLLDTGNFHPYVQYPLYPDIESGELIANSGNLKARLALAILARYHKMRTCSNPDCVTPYFLAKRTTQHFCERGECTRYAQNQYALKWWREKHKSQSTEKEGRNKRGPRKTR